MSAKICELLSDLSLSQYTITYMHLVIDLAFCTTHSAEVLQCSSLCVKSKNWCAIFGLVCKGWPDQTFMKPHRPHPIHQGHVNNVCVSINWDETPYFSVQKKKVRIIQPVYRTKFQPTAIVTGTSFKCGLIQWIKVALCHQTLFPQVLSSQDITSLEESRPFSSLLSGSNFLQKSTQIKGGLDLVDIKYEKSPEQSKKHKNPTR